MSETPTPPVVLEWDLSRSRATADVGWTDLARGQRFWQGDIRLTLRLPWRTVAGNVRYGMEMQRRFDRDVMRSRTEHFIQLVGLNGFERHYPSELSGGMQQRVNLARALAADPVVLLMDEPFAALDAQTREFMQAELLKIWSEARKTVLFITHQINEAVFLADRVAVMSARPGRVKGVVEIPFERPRGLALKRDARFLAIEEKIWQMVEESPDRIGMTKAAG